MITEPPSTLVQDRRAEVTGSAAALRAGWQAKLHLTFERRGDRSVLARNEHAGPLVVQKALYPEGPRVCHAIVLHPPGGIVSGDALSLNVTVGQHAHALLTTPGAAKWYRSSGSEAESATRLTVETGASLEWLPREAIVFDGARACARMDIDVAPQGRCIGWEIWCLGRTAAGERLRSGRLQLETRLRVAGRLRWEERGILDGHSPLLTCAAGLAGQPVFGALWAVGPQASASLIDACRRERASGAVALTQLPDVLIARYLGGSTEEAFAWFSTIWALLRPAYLERDSVRPRIWAV